MLGNRDVGEKVVVRRVVGVRAGRPVFTDVLGLLVAVSETDLTVQTASRRVAVPLAEVHRAKRVPARRPTGREIAALELASDAGWPAPVTGRVGDWRLRAALGWTGRANSALPVGDPGLPVPAAVDAVESWDAGHGLPAMINVPLPYASAVDAELVG
ncbi:MAG TPA: GNAT family N-acetyltransferase, partial [Pilimelia sp.]|nr:GNAT family N-acetyltransferase [Pilimelia sp.]